MNSVEAGHHVSTIYFKAELKQATVELFSDIGIPSVNANSIFQKLVSSVFNINIYICWANSEDFVSTLYLIYYRIAIR